MFDSVGYLVDRIGDLLSNVLRLDGGGPGDGAAPRPKGRTAVPNVEGLDVEDARHMLSREGFQVEVIRFEERPAAVMGTVVGQDPRPGTRHHRRKPVEIHVDHPRQS
ncbi:MAG: PASTA domain-containing protein [Actinomycetota bacterium]